MWFIFRHLFGVKCVLYCLSGDVFYIVCVVIFVVMMYFVLCVVIFVVLLVLMMYFVCVW